MKGGMFTSSLNDGDASRVTLEEFRVLTKSQLPVATIMGFDIVSLSKGEAVAKAAYQPQFLRPGGTIAGPISMALADYASYGAVLSDVGLVELAVTTGLSISFLRKPGPDDLYAHARLLAYTPPLAVVDVDLLSGANQQRVARVSCTYAIPRQ